MDATEEALLDHLEASLGEMLDARDYEVDRLDEVSVLRFPDAPRPGATTYATFGLSRAELHVAPGEHVRLELVCSVAPDRQEYLVADWLLTLVEHFAEVQEPPASDEERHHLWPLVDGSPVEGVCLLEVDEPFATLTRPGADPVLVRVLMPITRPEAAFIADFGWDELDRAADRIGVDFLDLGRDSILSLTERPEPCPTCGRDVDYHLPDGTPVPEVHEHP